MRAQAGYSLVELLVVLALLGLIAVAISGGMRFGARVWERTEAAVANVEQARGGHAYLRNLLSHVYPRAASAGQGEAFLGTRDRIAFLSSPSGSGGVARFVLRTQRVGTGIALILSQAAERGPAGEQENALLSGAKEIAFTYGEIKDGAVAWADDWQGRAELPALIRVRVIFADGRARWPDLIVRPRIDRAATCIYDPVSFDCRNG